MTVSPLESRPHQIGRIGALTQLVMLGLWLRVVAADLVEWTAQRKGQLCLFPDTRYYWELAGTILQGGPYEIVDWGNVPHFSIRTPGYPGIAVGGTGGHSFEERQHGAHRRHLVEGGDEVHLGGPRVGEAGRDLIGAHGLE